MHIGMGTGLAHQRGEAYPDGRLIREEFANCVLAEELGFDSVWIHGFTLFPTTLGREANARIEAFLRDRTAH